MTVKIPLNANTAILGHYANRHGLIAGATGTGKTVTLQTLCEGFSRAGVPVFVADVKGDIAGLAKADCGCDGNPVKFWDVEGTKGAPLRLSVSQVGPDLLARLLELTDAQKGIIETTLARFGDINDLIELRSSANACLSNSSIASWTATQRAVDRFERQGGGSLFEVGTKPFDVSQLFEYGATGRGVINILDAQKLIMSPVVYSTLLIWLLDQLFERMPEAGDLEKPRLVLFLDEAHLLFQDAPPALIQKLERTVRLIRSKGVGVYFVTQSPEDLPSTVLGQLGNRIQHRLSAATLRDQRALKAAAETMPINPAIDAAEAIGRLGTGEALVSVIGEGGVPQPCKRIRIQLPSCRLGALSDAERIQFMKEHADTLPKAAEVLGVSIRQTEKKMADVQTVYEIGAAILLIGSVLYYIFG